MIKNFILLSLLTLFILECLFIHPHHPKGLLATIKGLPILLGLAGSLLLFYFALKVGEGWLYRKEDYYD